MKSAALGATSTQQSAFIDRFAKQAMLRKLSDIQHGLLILIDGTETFHFGQRTERCPLSVTVHVREPRFYADVAFGGSIGAGEAYTAGAWHANDLTGLVRLLLNNRQVIDNVDTGLARLAVPMRKAFHWWQRNTRRGARRNIAAHYDLGNDFFQLFLDPSMMYSCAVFENPDTSLHDASLAKLDLICRKLGLQPGQRVLEIGAGWGGFALHAAGRYGCHVTTTTISAAQHAFALERIRAQGLEDRITLLCEDYRDLRGRYDKLVSIEMIEAIGHQQYDEFFRCCAERLEPNGEMLLQSITIADEYYEQARDEVDFIKRYIFPGSCIPSVGALGAAQARASDLRLVDLEDIGPHYATTLRAWRENLHRNIDAVRTLGYDDDFLRMWEFYLCYCEGGFVERALGDVHMLFAKPENRRLPVPR
jgi:cyclopropane-fatty-acyl-phospholipid synthase